MLAFLSDENFNGDIVRGLRRRDPRIDLVRAQDVLASGTEDPQVLAWAAEHQRIVLTHDRATFPHFAYERVAAGEAMAGVFVLHSRYPIGLAVDELLVLATCSEPPEWANLVLYLPL